MFEKIKYQIILRFGSDTQKMNFISKTHNLPNIYPLFKSLTADNQKELLKSLRNANSFIENLSPTELYEVFSIYPDLIFRIGIPNLSQAIQSLEGEELLHFLNKANSFGIKLYARLRQNSDIIYAMFKKLNINQKLTFLSNFRLDLNAETKKELLTFFLKDNQNLIPTNLYDCYLEIIGCYNKGLSLEFFNDFFKPEFLKSFKEISGLDPYILPKYCLNDPKINAIVSQTNINPLKFKIILQILYGDYPSFPLSQKLSALLKTAMFLNNYYYLSEDLIRNAFLKPEEQYALTYLLNHKLPNTSLNSIQDLEKVVIYQKDKIKTVCTNSSELESLKKLYIETCYGSIFNTDFPINISSLQKILNKHISPETDASIIKILEITSDIDMIHKITDIDVMKNKLLNIDFSSLVSNYTYGENLVANINQIYANDTNFSLINIQELPSSLIKIDPQTGMSYYDLSECEYGLLAHHSNIDPEKLISPNIIGYNHISLTPIGHRGKNVFKYVQNGVIYGYSTLPSENFILNSKRNSNSNLIQQNNYEYIGNPNIAYYPEEFETTCFETFNKETPETNAFREHLIPSCIILSGESPNQLEISARDTLSKVLGKSIPFIKTQPNNTYIASPKKTKKELKEEYLLEVKQNLVQRAQLNALNVNMPSDDLAPKM